MLLWIYCSTASCLLFIPICIVICHQIWLEPSLRMSARFGSWKNICIWFVSECIFHAVAASECTRGIEEAVNVRLRTENGRKWALTAALFKHSEFLLFPFLSHVMWSMSNVLIWNQAAFILVCFACRDQWWCTGIFLVRPCFEHTPINFD